jgi:hypothetical protein
MSSQLLGIGRFGDFFSTSECRDLLFHVQERRFTIPDIKSFLLENQLKFIGFDLAPSPSFPEYLGEVDHFMNDLDRWHALETKNPDIFVSMYQFWIQKNA